ncbi:MAG: hypothetical protein A3C88_02705 [Candidatus Yanofskybacteria bacterium RIFCSPHIGHO2_02_FULL_50_12]|uniref:Uncharacterized protein n=1 Tax=Candidatus Yanofskybacteria bacterium RIFCSPHIGHO2_02_FULL_50_12 TaxID=1802685 RepID=A0A1F8FVG1_9BACT|nr:MAG: hypothetical protein A3C88_02705 [Candidatus Yanofskybacteria bacterium RIFCSPHIGHO2_02_FULL_50_12]
MIEWIDERILALFTKFSHWFQRLTGLTNFFWARVCLGLFAVGILISVANYWFPILATETPLLGVMLASIWLAYVLAFTELTHRADQHFWSGANTKHSVQRVLSENAIERVLLLVVGALLLVLSFKALANNPEVSIWPQIYVSLDPGYLSSATYFAIVDPLPPGKSKVRQWIEEMQAGFRKLQPLSRPNR